MKKLFAVALSAVLAMGLVSCGDKKVKTTFDYIKDKGEVIWDTDCLTVTFEDYDATDPLAPTVKLKAENKSDDFAFLYVDGFYANDRYMANFNAVTMQAGETADFELDVADGAAEYAGIDEIGQLSFWLMHSETGGTYNYSDEIIINTDKTDWKENQKSPDGELLYDEDGLQISALLDDKNYMEGYLLPIYIKNDFKNAHITLYKMRIDGKETDVSDVNVISVKKGKEAIKFMVIYPAYEDISEYSKTEVKFIVSPDFSPDSDVGETFTTDYITIQGLTDKED